MIEKETKKLENSSTKNPDKGESDSGSGEIIDFSETEQESVSREKREKETEPDTEREAKPDPLEGEFAETDPEHTIEKSQGQRTGEQQEAEKTGDADETPVIDFAAARKRLGNVDQTNASNARASQEIADKDIRRQAA